jgi:hypothetical protein
MASDETEWQMATRHVREQKSRIAMQESLIAGSHRSHLPTRHADEFLDLMYDLLAVMEAHVARLLIR